MRRYEIIDQAWKRVCELLPGKSTDIGRTPKITASSLMPCSGLRAAVPPGETIPNAVVAGTRSIDASAAGLLKASGSASSKPCKSRIWTGSCSTRPPSEPTSTRLVKKTTAAVECLGRSRGDFSTKIHACCNALSNPHRFILSPGEQSDHKQAKALLAEDRPLAVIADKGYDSNNLAQFLTERHAQVVIPSRANAKVRCVEKDGQ